MRCQIMNKPIQKSLNEGQNGNRPTLVKTKLGLKRSVSSPALIWQGKCESFFKAHDETEKFQLVVTSPPYNIGKSYETRRSLEDYLEWQKSIIENCVKRLSETGSICWQVGNFVENGEIHPLDIELAPFFRSLGLQLRNRIIWKFGHGLHNKRRFSGRYETILWFTKGKEYKFNVDAVRIPSKYPNKKHFKGPNVGKLSGHPLGKNPEDVWEIPNVKNNHVEKTDHPCQFPVGLIERLILALTDRNDKVFDPFAGVGSAGVAAILHGRRTWNCELDPGYAATAAKRFKRAFIGEEPYRPHVKPIYQPR